MEFSKGIRTVYEINQKEKFLNEYSSLCQDYNKLIVSGNNLLWLVIHCRVNLQFIVDATNNILKDYCNKYGFNYECSDWKNAFIILNEARISMQRLGKSKADNELKKEILKRLF